MKKRISIFALVTLIVLVLTMAVSCAKHNVAGDAMMNGVDKEFANGSTGGTVAPGVGSDVISDERKIIKKVNESVQTENYDEFMTQLKALIETCGGYISSASHSGDNYYNKNLYRNSHLVVRIPAERLDEFTGGVNGLGVVCSYSESMDDVTGAYVDLESRIAVLTAEESALIEMLSGASTVSQTLEIRESLNRVQADLASYKAQKQAYDSQISYSTVNMSIQEVRQAEVVNPGFFEEVRIEFNDSMYDLGRNLRDFAVWFLGNIVEIVIFAAFATGGTILVVKIVKHRRVKKAEKASANDEKTENNE